MKTSQRNSKHKLRILIIITYEMNHTFNAVLQMLTFMLDLLKTRCIRVAESEKVRLNLPKLIGRKTKQNKATKKNM